MSKIRTFSVRINDGERYLDIPAKNFNEASKLAYQIDPENFYHIEIKTGAEWITYIKVEKEETKRVAAYIPHSKFIRIHQARIHEGKKLSAWLNEAIDAKLNI
jgi:hypothetical protein